MLGVKLKATYQQSRKVNGDELVEKFSNRVGPWKGGRFMPLSLRPWALNSYALPLVWYHCHSIDLREGDCAKMTSIFKSWLYADLLEKP